jgi:hypothetical protein
VTGPTGPQGGIGPTGPAGTAGATVASGVSFSPVGGVAATNVQLAINELDLEKANRTELERLDVGLGQWPNGMGGNLDMEGYSVTGLGTPGSNSDAISLGWANTNLAAKVHGHALTDANITGTLAIAKGGTGGTTAATARAGLSAAGAYSEVFATALVAGTWSANITHSFNSLAVDVTVTNLASGEAWDLDWKTTGANTVQIRADLAVAANALGVLVTAKG